SGNIQLLIDESTTVGGTFSTTAGIGINNGEISFTGNFSATNINTGTLADARLSNNVSLLGQTIEGSEITNGTIQGVDVANDTITDTQLQYNTGQHLTTSSSPTFSSLDLASTGVVRFGGTAGYGYTSDPRYAI